MVSDKIEDSYDNSSISTYQTCPMSYYLQYIVGIKKNTIDDSNAQMHFGSAVHSFLENYFLQDLDKAETVIKEYEQPASLPQYSKQALKLFCDTYCEVYTSVDKDFKVLEVEKNSSMNIGEYTFTVKRDGAVQINGNVFSLEHKTTKSISQMYFDKYYLNSQITAQCADVNNKYGKCSGVLLNVGEIKNLKRKPTKKYQGVQELDDGTWLACSFERDYINRKPAEIEDWKANTLLWIQRIEQSKQTNQWPKSTGLWGGSICNHCEYKELCKFSHQTDLDKSTRAAFYKDVDPFAYLKEGE